MSNLMEAIEINSSSSEDNQDHFLEDDNVGNPPHPFNDEVVEVLSDSSSSSHANNSNHIIIPTDLYSRSYPDMPLGSLPSTNHLSYNNGRLSFLWHGKPQPLARPRFFRRGIFSPSGQKIKNCKQFLTSQMESNDIDLIPYEAHISVQVKIFFFMQRPLHHFVGGRRTIGNLRNEHRSAPFFNWTSNPTGPDVDNLTKFVLDSMNKIVYHDDRQVVKIEAYKILDCNGLCLGRTEVQVCPVQFLFPGFWFPES